MEQPLAVNVREAAWNRIVAKLNITGKPIPQRFDSLADAVARFEEYGAAEPRSND